MSRESRHAVRAVFLAAIMVISVFAAGIAFSGSAAAQQGQEPDLIVDNDFNNPDQDTNFSSIQKAVDNAAEDEIIVVRSGNYDESVTVDVSGLTIEAADGASPTVSPPESNGRTNTITISANGVTVEGLEIEATGGSTPRGIVLTGDDTSALNNNISHADSVADKSRTGPLIAVDGGDSVTVDGNTVTDGPIAYVGGSKNQVNFTNNTVEGDLVDEAFFAFGGTDPDLTFTGNDFSAADAGQDADVKFDLSSVAVNGQTDASSIVDTTQSSNTGAGVVEVDGDQFTDLETLFIRPGDDISAAIDSADSLSGVNTVQLADGTYDQSVTVDVEGLTLEAANGASPTLNSTGNKTVTLQGTDITIADLTITNSGGGNGIDIPSKQNASGLRLDGVTIANTSIAFFNDLDGNTEPDFTDVVFTDVTIENSERKGIYTEALSDAIFDEVIVDDVGSDNYGFNTGIDINLKYDDYQNVTIQNSVVANVSEGDPFRDDPAFATGIGIKARDDPSSYDGNPATLDDVTVDNVTIEDSFNGLRIGEPGVDYSSAPQGPTDVTITDSTFQNNSGYHVEDVPGNLALGDVLNNQANEFDRVVTIEDDAGNITGNSIFAAIQPTVDDASSGDTVSVSDGTYNESVEISTQSVTLEGPNSGTPGYEDRQSAEAVIEQGVVISADSVTLDGFEVTNNAGNGIKVANATSNVVITNNRVADITGGTAGDQKAFANGINLQFNDAFKKTSSGIEITNNEIHNTTTEDIDSRSNDVIGIQLLPRGNDVEDLRIADNIISDIEAGDASSDGRSEARGISIDTQFIDEANGDTRGDFGQAKNLTIEENEIRNLTSEYSRALALFEDTGGSTSNPGTPIGPVNFTIRFNTIDNLTSEDPDGNVDAQSTALFIGGYGNLGDEHQFVANNVEEGAVSRLLYGQVNPPESADLLNAGENWWGNDDGPRASSSSGTVGRVATAPFLTVPYQQLENTDDGTPRQFATELELTGGVNTIAFPAPSERTLNESLNLSNVENVLVYDNSEGNWTTAGNPTPDALDVYVVIVEEGETASLVMEFDNDFDADNTQLSTAEVSGGWNLVSPSQAADTADGAYATRNAEIGLTSENPFQSPHRQPFDADNAEFSPYRGYWTFVDEDDGPSTVGSSNFEGLTLLDYLENVNLPPEDE